MEASCCAEKGVSMLDVGKNFTAEDAANGKCSPSELSTDEFLRYIALLSEPLITPSKHSEATAEDVLGRNSDISSLSSEELVRLFLILVNKEPDADTAKTLLSKFGSPERVLAAPVAALENIPGVGFDTAVRLSLAHSTVVRALSGSGTARKTSSNPAKNAEHLLSGRISALSSESFAYVFADEKNNLSKVFAVRGEASAEISVSSGEIIENAAYLGAHTVFAAHNHPDGGAVSQRDIESTSVLRERLAAFSIKLEEHFVFSRGTAETKAKTYYIIRDYIDIAK